MLTDDGSGGAQAGRDALHRLKSTEPPLYLTPSPDLSKAARSASEYLFSSLNPFAPKSPFPRLLTEGFDAEQIWQQIDLQSRPLLSSLRRHLRNNFEKKKNNPSPPQIDEKQLLFNSDLHIGKEVDKDNDSEDLLPTKDFDGLESESEGFDDDDDDDDDDDVDDGSDDDDDDEAEEGEENAEEEMKKSETGVEDRFLKIKELEEYLEEDEAREYGLNKGQGKKKKNKRNRDEDEDDDEDENEEDELGVLGIDHSDEDAEWMETARYDDFFGSKKDRRKKNYKQLGKSDESEMDDDPNSLNDNQAIHTESIDLEMDDDPNNLDDKQKKQTLSTHEKEREKLQSEIEKMEKANLEPKTWTMQGEVTASKRPKNSALEVDLDFEHNVRPAPVITEEVTASLEELIQNRIVEGRFDDVLKPPTLLNKAPREKVELDESKSKKGLAELYEDEYAQKTGLVSTALTFSDEQKKEASQLFKKLCLKLDALSHFHFTPKPVIEDMSIQSNVPALAMEEIAPLAVSDAAMLAPEEVFAGKGDIKEETELTKGERKRRRSNKKRKFKAEAVKQMAIKAQKNTYMNQRNGNEDSQVVT